MRLLCSHRWGGHLPDLSFVGRDFENLARSTKVRVSWQRVLFKAAEADLDRQSWEGGLITGRSYHEHRAELRGER
jgi:hypothetical protein